MTYQQFIVIFNEKRYAVVLLLCIANAICYADRTNIGIAVPYFLEDRAGRGIVLSAFFYGYILTQIPAGFWASQIGVKNVLAIGVVVWTVCDVSTVLVSNSIPWLIFVRALMGCGEGVIMPSLLRFATNWFPLSERSTLVAVISSGSDLGTILALFLSPWIIKVTGEWKVIFVVFGGFSAIWMLFYLRNVTSRPEQHPRISQHEKDFILSTRASSNSSLSMIPWWTLLTNKHCWVIYLAHFCSNYGWYVLLGWLPAYFYDKLGLDLKENKLLAATPYICGYFGLLVSGRTSDYFIAKGVRTLTVRRWMNSIGSFGPALTLCMLQFATTPSIAICLLSGALFTGRASTSGFWINMIDVAPDYAGQIMGVSNTIATVPGILGNLITGYILQKTQSWNTVFNVAALVSSFGGLAFACLSTDRNVFRRNEGDYVRAETELI